MISAVFRWTCDVAGCTTNALIDKPIKPPEGWGMDLVQDTDKPARSLRPVHYCPTCWAKRADAAEREAVAVED